MITGQTESGFKYEISQERLNNYELVEQLGELEENPLALSNVVKLLLGKEQTKSLKDHLRGEDGFVPSDKMMNEIKEIFLSQAETKNS